MTKSLPDPAELAARIERSMAKGLDLVDAFRSVTGSGPQGANRALEVEHRKSLAANRTVVRRHTSKVQRLKAEMTGGAVVAGTAGAIGVMSLRRRRTRRRSSGSAAPPSDWRSP